MPYIGNIPAAKYSSLTQQTFASPTGTSFTLSQSVTNSKDVALFIDNVRQDPSGYTASGTTLTTSTISSPSTMYCLFNGRTTETVSPPDGSVGTAKLVDANVTDAKISTMAASKLTGALPAISGASLTGVVGKIVQVVHVQNGVRVTTTTIIPYDDTEPQITEGGEFDTLAITPTSSSNKLLVSVVMHFSHSSTGGPQAMIGLFNTDVHATNAIATSNSIQRTGGDISVLKMEHYLTAPTTSATTFIVRFGSNVAGTAAIGGHAARMNGVMQNTITITEIAV